MIPSDFYELMLLVNLILWWSIDLEKDWVFRFYFNAFKSRQNYEIESNALWLRIQARVEQEWFLSKLNREMPGFLEDLSRLQYSSKESWSDILLQIGWGVATWDRLDARYVLPA